MDRFGEKLRDARLALGLKQSEVAEKLGCAPTSLTNWESGKVRPSFGVLSALCSVYGVSPLALLDREYGLEDLTDIAEKEYKGRSYEEQVALNFSGAVMRREAPGLFGEDERKEAELSRFQKETDLFPRMGGAFEWEIEAIRSEYERNGGADKDILYAFHALTGKNKDAFLAVLHGLLLSDGGAEPFTEGVLKPEEGKAGKKSFAERLEKARGYTLARLYAQRKYLRGEE